MDMKTKDMVRKKLLDAQEMVRDYEMFSKKVRDTEIAETFKMFAEETGMQARRLQAIVDKLEGNK
ncbi:hypothetical protein [Caldisalinibacter kiritimatiensis]|uniref:Uncharacterized protein n=1 Tax=Caldisalinibacter kiritimatiensis TaxID=1304284 RepID=R1CH84_9FIRM|nr:hypothetical protein [Caldisalinibacter kiritimatiensis]EOD01655.1 hypothetical protein L21TH_0261 [Caldisalinibacter kiritimatiensis]